MADDPTPEDATPEDRDPIDWESPRWQERGRDEQADVEFERRYRNVAPKAYSGAIDTPGAVDRKRADDAGASDAVDEDAGENEDPAGGPGRA